MHEFLKLTLAQKLSDKQSEVSYEPIDFNLIGKTNPFKDPLVLNEINKAQETFNEYFPNGDERNRDWNAVSMNMTYINLSEKDSDLGHYVRDTFKSAGAFVGHYKNIMGLNHTDLMS